eukprot:m.124730 g.124730  ORF g.124730 m.124730 type:complete len:77 (+) comp13781_c0_seq12:1358-1588(+)
MTKLRCLYHRYICMIYKVPNALCVCKFVTKSSSASSLIPSSTRVCVLWVVPSFVLVQPFSLNFQSFGRVQAPSAHL